eukprot:4707088-Amphidinium_carterae.1
MQENDAGVAVLPACGAVQEPKDTHDCSGWRVRWWNPGGISAFCWEVLPRTLEVEGRKLILAKVARAKEAPKLRLYWKDYVVIFSSLGLWRLLFMFLEDGKKESQLLVIVAGDMALEFAVRTQNKVALGELEKSDIDAMKVEMEKKIKSHDGTGGCKQGRGAALNLCQCSQ